MASNRGTLLDGNNVSSDWIEIHNAGDEAANLLGYSLSDDATDTTKFVLPTHTIDPGGYLVVFASGNNAPDAEENIHTNFKLSSGGEFIGFYDADGNVLSEFGAGAVDYPEQVTDVSFGLDVSGGQFVDGSERYFVAPSPGSINTPNAADLRPLIADFEKFVGAADANTSIVVTARPITVGSTINTVRLFTRTNYGGELQITMRDDGTGGDVTSGDGVYTATISSNRFGEGDQVRWRVEATATNGLTGKGPAFLDAEKSPEYLGTVVADSTTNTQLPVVEWFAANQAATNSRNGTRGSVFYSGEFYDNVFIRSRGQSSNNSPKKNLKFDFNPGDRFLLESDSIRVDEFNLNNTYYDQADIRATLASEVFVSAGLPSAITFPIHTRSNGEFYSLAVYVEQIDADFLERNGLDPNGALYKVTGNNGFNPAAGLTGFQKRTRLDEGNEAVQELADAVDENQPQEARAQYLYDNVDVFSVINYLAGTSIIHNVDHVHKNHFVYQDTEGTGKWSFIPWDLDLTFGKNGANTPNTEVYDADETNQNSNRYPNSHPLFGGSEYPRFDASDIYNRLIDAVLDTPEFRELYLRRLRTVMDEVLQDPNTPVGELRLESRIAELLTQIQSDWDADDARWIEAPQTDKDRGTDWGEDLPLATHFQRIIDRYLEPRRNHLFDTHNIANAAVAQNLVENSDSFRYFIPTGNIASWTTEGFNDSAWTVGDQGIGYDRNGGYDSQIETDLESELFNQRTTVYTRTDFNISTAADLNQITDLILEADYDDGFIAFINGVEVTRSGSASGNGFGATSSPHEASGNENFVLGADALNALQVGNNVLAIQGINTGASSSDLLLRFTLTGTSGGDPEIAGIPNQQSLNPQIDFDVNDFDASPISGNQSQEYLRLNNLNNTAVDISGWQFNGGIDVTFRAGTVIPAGGSLYVVADVVQFLNRTSGPSGEQNLLTYGNFSGQLGFEGEQIRLVSADATVIDTFDVPATQGSDLQSFLRVTEISFNPNTTLGVEEFIELTNISSGGAAITLDLADAQISEGPSTPFVFQAGTTLAPGQRLLVVKDIAAFQAAYPSVPASQIAGEFAGSLSNGGETIRVDDAGNNKVFEVNYGDSNPWYFAADGEGATLELVDETGTPFNELGKYYSWRASVANGGTPGTGPVDPSGIVINEILAHTDDPQFDSIELFNTTSASVDIGGWFLSDSAASPFKYQIPSGTTLGTGQYFVFDENDFNPNPTNPGPNDFSLSSLGDEVFLTRNVAGEAAFEDVVEFNATFNGKSHGRLPNGTGRLTQLDAVTLGDENGIHEDSDLIISEVHYNPASPTTSNPDISDNDVEFVEIFNRSNNFINLAQWRLRGEVDFDFAAGSLAPGEAIVIVPFDPASAANAELLDVFRSEYGIDSSVTLVGGYSGNLSNSFGRVSLQQADTPAADDPTATPFVTVDEVIYDDLTPFPDADGNGSSLNRISGVAFGNFGASWDATAPSPGAVALTVLSAQIESRLVFYNNSSFDTASDDAIDTNKQALLPGQTATFANYTSYVHGLNGLFVDIFNVGSIAQLGPSDFVFATGDGNDFSDYAQVQPVFTVNVRVGEGASGSDRIGFEFADGAITQTWLQVTVQGNANTGLADDDVFYFGNVIGETGDSTSDTIVNASDIGLVRNNLSGFSTVGIESNFDFDRNGRVDATDIGIARNNLSGFFSLSLITAPGGSQGIFGFRSNLGSGSDADNDKTNGQKIVERSPISNEMDRSDRVCFLDEHLTSNVNQFLLFDALSFEATSVKKNSRFVNNSGSR